MSLISNSPPVQPEAWRCCRMPVRSLIGNTFVLVNDIRYVDKGQKSKVVGGIFKVLGAAASIVTGSNKLQ